MEVAAPLVMAALLARINRGFALRHEGWVRRWAAERRAMWLRARVRAGRGEHVDLGTSDETGGVPSGSPDLVSNEVRLDLCAVPASLPIRLDDEEQGDSGLLPYREGVLPAGVSLAVRGFEGARRVLRESITRAGGETVQRYSFEVPRSTWFWILGVPRSLWDAAPAEGPIRLSPLPGGLRLTTDVPPGAPVSHADDAKPLRWPFPLLFAYALLAYAAFDSQVVQRIWIGGMVVLGGRFALRALNGFADAEAPALPAEMEVDGPAASEGKGLVATRSKDLGAANDLPDTPAMIGLFESPLWLQGLSRAEEWLLPNKPSSMPRVVIFDMDDPGGRRGSAKDELLTAAFLLSDAVWLRTSLTATVVLSIEKPWGRVFSNGAPRTWPDISRMLPPLPPSTVVVWGASLGDPRRSGFQLSLRWMDGTNVREGTLVGPLPDLAESLVDWLVQIGAGQREPTPRGFEPPNEDFAAWAYKNGVQSVIEDTLLRRDLKHGLPRIDDEGKRIHQRLRRTYFEGQERYLRNGCQIPLLGIASAIQDAGAGWLADARRAQIAAALKEADLPPALVRLAPAILFRLGLKEEAHARRTALLADGSGPYRGEASDLFHAWLRRLDGEP